MHGRVCRLSTPPHPQWSTGALCRVAVVVARSPLSSSRLPAYRRNTTRSNWKRKWCGGTHVEGEQDLIQLIIRTIIRLPPHPLASPPPAARGQKAPRR